MSNRRLGRGTTAFGPRPWQAWKLSWQPAHSPSRIPKTRPNFRPRKRCSQPGSTRSKTRRTAWPKSTGPCTSRRPKTARPEHGAGAPASRCSRGRWSVPGRKTSGSFQGAGGRPGTRIRKAASLGFPCNVVLVSRIQMPGRPGQVHAGGRTCYRAWLWPAASLFPLHLCWLPR